MYHLIKHCSYKSRFIFRPKDNSEVVISRAAQVWWKDEGKRNRQVILSVLFDYQNPEKMKIFYIFSVSKETQNLQRRKYFKHFTFFSNTFF